MTKVHFVDQYLLNPTHPITVNLIGVGGTGSHVLSALARISHARISLGYPGLFVCAFDPDEVSQTNIGRQLFSQSDLGLNKAEVLVTRINRFFGSAWEAVPEIYKQGKANITISCVDNITSRLSISKSLNLYSSNVNRYEQEHQRCMYWLDFGNGKDYGQFVLGSVGKIQQPQSQKYQTVGLLRTVTELFDFTQMKDEESGPSCSQAEALKKQDLFINSSLAQLGSSFLWQFLTVGIIQNQGAYLNLSSMQSTPILL